MSPLGWAGAVAVVWILPGVALVLVLALARLATEAVYRIGNRLRWWYIGRLVRSIAKGRKPRHIVAAIRLNDWRRARGDRRAMKAWDKASAAVDLAAWQASVAPEFGPELPVATGWHESPR